MACKEVNKSRCFTFIWKIENINFWWRDGYIESPVFTVNGIDETRWCLQLLFPFEDKYSVSYLYLNRQEDYEGVDYVQIDCELAFVSADGTVLHSFKVQNAMFGKTEKIEFLGFTSWHELFHKRRSVFSPRNTLTVRCRIWKSVGEISKDVQCFARSRMVVEKRSFMWDIGNFSTLELDKEQVYEIKTLDNCEQIMQLNFFVSGGQMCDEVIHLTIIPNFKIMKTSTLKLSIVDASKNTVKGFEGEFCFYDLYERQEFTLFYTKGELVEKKMQYLPNDVLSLLCECSFCFGMLVQEIEDASSKLSAIENVEQVDVCLNKPNELTLPHSILIDNLKSMLNNNCLSDVKLRTSSQTYPAHTAILGARSPVFKAMFSSDMKVKIKDCVDIEDLSNETVLRMLRYIYSAEVEQLEWGRAIDLYEAADKYKVLNLRDICSSYLKNNLCRINACEALVLADLHKDEDLKRFVQDFILRHGKDIINSEEWKQLMKTNLKLAAETLCLQFKE